MCQIRARYIGGGFTRRAASAATIERRHPQSTTYLPTTIQCPAWCNDHSGLAGLYPDEDGGWHVSKPVTIGAFRLSITSGGENDPRPDIMVNDDCLTPTHARLLAQALVMAADAVGRNCPL